MKATLNASYDSCGRAQHFELRIALGVQPDRQTADQVGQAFAETFPKTYRVKPSACYEADHTVSANVWMQVQLTASGANGGRNEGGIKRYRKVIAMLAERGIEMEWRAPYRNAFPTQTEFEQAIA